MVKHIPNFLTCCNLLCGCVGIVEAFLGNLTAAAYFIGLAAVFDFLDGLSARMLKAVSSIGKQLDSFADLISFGLLPAAILYIMIYQNISSSILSQLDLDNIFNFQTLPAYTAFLIPVFSAIRLAKFNIDTRQSDSFIGLPTPANAILIGSLPLILANDTFHLSPVILNSYFLIPTILLLCYLLISKLSLFSLKFKNISWGQNKIRFIFLLISLVLIIMLTYTAIPLIIFLYIFMSLIDLGYSSDH